MSICYEYDDCQSNNVVYNSHNMSYFHDSCNFQSISALNGPQYVLAATFTGLFRVHSMFFQLVHIRGHELFNGYFWFKCNDEDELINIEKCNEVPNVYLCVEKYFYLELNGSILSVFTDGVFHSCSTQPYYHELKNSVIKYVYEEYYEGIVDYLISAQDVIMAKTRHTFDMSHKVRGQISHNKGHEDLRKMEDIQDIYYPDRQYGHMALQSFDFQFIGSEREIRHLDSTEKFLETANTILKTGLPNYRGAQIPIATSLNWEVWENISIIMQTNVFCNISDMAFL